jgi:hypothetical protein
MAENRKHNFSNAIWANVLAEMQLKNWKLLLYSSKSNIFLAGNLTSREKKHKDLFNTRFG